MLSDRNRWRSLPLLYLKPNKCLSWEEYGHGGSYPQEIGAFVRRATNGADILGFGGGQAIVFN